MTHNPLPQLSVGSLVQGCSPVPTGGDGDRICDDQGSAGVLGLQTTEIRLGK